MIEINEEMKKPSFGGDVADFLGTLRSRQTNQLYNNSRNPYGNPFKGSKTIEEMVSRFVSVHPKIGDLEILSQSLDSFFGVGTPDEPEELPEEYSHTKTLLSSLIEEKSKRR